MRRSSSVGPAAFGGSAARTALTHDEGVKRRKWLEDQRCLDRLGAMQHLPDADSTEMAIDLGLLRAARVGLTVGGTGLILPAMLVLMALARA